MGKNLINEALMSCFPGKSIVNFLDKYSSVEMHFLKLQNATLCTKVHFTRFLSDGFTTMAVMSPPEKKLEKRTSVQSDENT